jgi:hypothetical protein
MLVLLRFDLRNIVSTYDVLKTNSILGLGN